MDALARKGPLDTRQLAMRVIRAKGLSESNNALAQTVAIRVPTLRMRARLKELRGPKASVCGKYQKGADLF